MTDVRAQAVAFIEQLLASSEHMATHSPLLDDDLLQGLSPLFAPGRETTGAEVRSAVLVSLARYGLRPFCWERGS